MMTADMCVSLSSAEAYKNEDVKLVSTLQLQLANTLVQSGVCAFNLYVNHLSRVITVDLEEAEIDKIYHLSEEHLTRAIRIYQNWNGPSRVEYAHTVGDHFAKATKHLAQLRNAKQRGNADYIEDDLNMYNADGTAKKSATSATKKYMKRKKR